jgi:diphosphomevalonate decarboxylase
MNLNSCFTTTTTEFNPKYKKDKIYIGGVEVQGVKKERVVNILDLVRTRAKIKFYAKVESKNNFPSDVGIASSASGFSALALSASIAAGLNLSQKELSILARMGSGSACRSIPDGFTYWKKGKDNKSSYAVSIARPEFWDIRDVVAIVSKKGKKVGSTEGHELATTSPYFKTRIKNMQKKIRDIKNALLNKDFKTFGTLVEEEAVDLHVMAMTSHPAVFYWNSGTMDVMKTVFELREKGILCYFTMDAGPNVHIICFDKDEKKIINTLKKLSSVCTTISNKPGNGARIIK